MDYKELFTIGKCGKDVKYSFMGPGSYGPFLQDNNQERNTGQSRMVLLVVRVFQQPGKPFKANRKPDNEKT